MALPQEEPKGWLADLITFDSTHIAVTLPDVSTTRRGDKAPEPDKVVTVPQLPPTGCELVLITLFSTQAAVAFPFASTTIWGSVAFVAVTERVTGADQLIGPQTACEIA